MRNSMIDTAPRSRPRLAWFSPMPPVRSGVAACSADLVSALSASLEIDVFVDEPVARIARGTRSAHDFVWRHAQAPYDLTIFQMGNSSNHDYIWPYLFRFPGLTVLHDVHLHHARAAALLRNRRASDYRVEFSWNHPDANPNLAEVAVAGFDTHLYYAWPMTRLVAESSRLVAVHSAALAATLAADAPSAKIDVVRLGHGETMPAETQLTAQRDVRARFDIPDNAVLFGCFGGLAPDKRIPEVLTALEDIVRYVPTAHLLLAGAPASHYDVADDVRRRGLSSRTRLTGYLESDDDLTASLAACDVAINLRWPTAREISGPWLRALALGKPTIVVDLAHLSGVPSLDPRTWQPHQEGQAATVPPICVAIDILDEVHSLKLAMRRLATDASLREALGEAGREYWTREHSVTGMVEDYRRVIARALQVEVAPRLLPAHAIDDGGSTLRQLLDHLGVASPLG